MQTFKLEFSWQVKMSFSNLHLKF